MACQHIAAILDIVASRLSPNSSFSGTLNFWPQGNLLKNLLADTDQGLAACGGRILVIPRVSGPLGSAPGTPEKNLSPIQEPLACGNQVEMKQSH